MNFTNEKEARDYERHLIEKLDAIKSSGFYNLGPGGFGGGSIGRELSESTRKKISKSLMGGKHSEKSRLLMKDKRKNLVYTPKYKENLSIAIRKHWSSKSHKERENFSETAKQRQLALNRKCSDADKMRISKERSKLSKEDVLNIFKMKEEGLPYKEMSARYGINLSSISAILNKQSYKWIWNGNNSI